MIFDKSKVYTALNAEELSKGDLIIGADTLAQLKEKVEIRNYKDLLSILEIRDNDKWSRFDTQENYYSLAYLVCPARNAEAFKAWYNGQKIEMEYAEPNENESSVWRLFECEEPNWCKYHYRPAPKEITGKEYRPFASIDELITEFEKRFKTNVPSYALPLIWVRQKIKNERYLITGFVKSEQSGVCVKIGNAYYGLGVFFDHYEFLDGSPCGVEQ